MLPETVARTGRPNGRLERILLIQFENFSGRFAPPPRKITHLQKQPRSGRLDSPPTPFLRLIFFPTRNFAIPLGQRQRTGIGLGLLVREFVPIAALDSFLRHVTVEIEQAEHTANEGDRAE